jgi:glycosyltransferase involved in cell wall biosynthesis
VNRPAVSVVIPTYNNAPYLLEALESVSSQSFRDVEVVVVDDGSTDGTRSLLEPHLGRIRYYPQRNQGVAVARNVGLELAEGELVTWLDGDDVMLPGNLEVKVGVLRRHPELGGVFSDFRVFDRSGVLHARGMKEIYPFFRKTGKDFPEIFRASERIAREDGCAATMYSGEIFDCLFQGNFILNSTVLFRKRAALQVGKFVPSLRTQEDYEYWLRFSKRYPLGFVDEPLVKYRRHPRQLTDRSNIARIIETSLRIVEGYEEEFRGDGKEGIFKARKAEMLMNLSKAYLGMDRSAQARAALRQGILLDPRRAEGYAYFLLTLLPHSAVRLLHERRKKP